MFRGVKPEGIIEFIGGVLYNSIVPVIVVQSQQGYAAQQYRKW